MHIIYITYYIGYCKRPALRYPSEDVQVLSRMAATQHRSLRPAYLVRVFLQLRSPRMHAMGRRSYKNAEAK